MSNARVFQLIPAIGTAVLVSLPAAAQQAPRTTRQVADAVEKRAEVIAGEQAKLAERLAALEKQSAESASAAEAAKKAADAERADLLKKLNDMSKRHAALKSRIENPPPPPKPPVRFTPYGFVLMNAVHNSGSPAGSLDAPGGALAGSEGWFGGGAGLSTDGSTVISIRQSRLGLGVEIDLTEKFSGEATVEMDFWGLHTAGGAGGITQPAPRLRLAYFDLGTHDFRVRVGQDSSIVTPRTPTSLSHLAVPMHSGSGMIWTRLPQVAVQWTHGVDTDRFKDAELGLQAALVRNHSGEADSEVTQLDVRDAGAAAESYGLQGRLFWGSQVLTVGVAGHVGREAYEIEPADGLFTSENVDSWLGSADLRVAYQRFWLAGQGWIGQNVNGFHSNFGVRRMSENDSVDPSIKHLRSVEGVPGHGGWFEVGLALRGGALKLVGGAGGEASKADKLSTGAVGEQGGIHAGLIFAPHKHFDGSIEYLHTWTKFNSPDPVNNQPRTNEGQSDSISWNLRAKF